MRGMFITIDLAALGVLLGAVTQVVPAIAGLLAVIYYGFVIYDRIVYGPELDKRTLWRFNKKEKEKLDNENGQA